MEQKFVSFEDAIEKLGISAERLHALREGGELRAYRDGKSWKFRTDEIQGMVDSGVPEPSPPSDVGLVSREELVEAAPIDVDDNDSDLSLVSEEELEQAEASPPAKSAEKSDLDLELELDDTDSVPGGSELEPDGLEDTVTAGSSDIDLDLELPEAGPSDSILLSEETLGESVSGPKSTIIGKDKLGSADDDLELALDDDDGDVTADVLSSQVAGSGVLDDVEKKPGSSAFEGLEELDLAEESSPALAPEKAAEGATPPEASDLQLDDLELEGGSNMGSTDVPVLEDAAGDATGSGSELELASSDDLLASDSGGSDLTLDSGDSGINLISPSDSGLALDDIPLEMGGSAILSSLSLEGSDPDISLIGDEAAASGDAPIAELQTDDDFQLTPLSEGANDDGDSSSQVIELDADMGGDLEGGMEDFGDAAVLDEGDFAEEEGDVVLSEDFAETPGDDLDMGYAPGPAAATIDRSYSMLNILGLGSSALLLLLGGTMMLDMMRNIWSWNEPYTLNSSLMDAILGWF